MKAVGLTDVGMNRSSNQDTIFCSPGSIGCLPNFFVVADGMGGQKAGDYASKSFVEKLLRHIKHSRGSEHVKVIRTAIEASNKQLYNESCDDPNLSGMGTTLVAAMIENGTMYVFNAGDSRLYLYRDHLAQITRDHSYVEEMVSLGKMERGSSDYNNNKNIITKAIGISPKISYDVFEIELFSKDRILLCSDGLTNMLNDAIIEKELDSNENLDDAAAALIDAANKKGGQDNISVILISPDECEVKL